MTVAHEETWTAKLETRAEGNLDLEQLWIVVDGDGHLVADTTSEKKAALLIAAAPDMARLLLDLERAGATDCGPWEAGSPCCPACKSEDDHQPDCQWVAALRKAGVR